MSRTLIQRENDGVEYENKYKQIGFYQKKRIQNNLTLVWQIEAKQNK